MEEEQNEVNGRQLAKKLREKFLEENECVELDPKASLRPCCGEVFQNYDDQSHDAWLLQCPKGMDPQQLAGKQIKLPGRRFVGDLQVRASNYSTPLREAVGYVTSEGKYALRKLLLTGHVVVSKRLNVTQPGEGQGDASSKFPGLPPPPLYCPPYRHPFFGRDYKKYIDVPKEISRRLNLADKRYVETSAKLRRTANYYKIRRNMLTTTKTLAEKEREVRQSVLNGLTPDFMKNLTAPPSSFLNDIEGIKRKPEYAY